MSQQHGYNTRNGYMPIISNPRTEWGKKTRQYMGLTGNWAKETYVEKEFYHRQFRWYATLENKTPAETFPKFPSILHVIDMSDRNLPIRAR